MTNIIKKYCKIIKDQIIKAFYYKDIKRDYSHKLANNSIYRNRTIKNLMKQIDVIDKNIISAHGKFELYVMQAMMITLPLKGPILELGCYKGGSTAKISLICKLTGRKLYAFDSFEGLPSPTKKDIKHKLTPFIIDKEHTNYKKGLYAGSLEEVKKNIEKYGCIDVCQFIKGYFEDTLPHFQVKPACIFMDVDYIESAYTALKFFWPRLLPNGLFFTHEATASSFIEAITNSDWWEKELNQKPPLIYGAGYGTNWRYGSLSFPSNIAYFIKK